MAMFRVRALLALVALVPMAGAARAEPVDPYKQQPTPAPGAAAPGRAPAAPETGPSQPDPDAGPATPAPAPSGSSPGSAAPAPDARAAPQDPYAPAPAAPAPDPVLAQRIAQALVSRAQELFDARSFLDAKQLAVEALVSSPQGAAAEHARAIIRAVNRELGISEDSPRPEQNPTPTTLARPGDDVDTTPIQDPTLSPAPPEGGLAGGLSGPSPSRTMVARVHGGLYTGLLGTTIGAFLSSDSPAKGAVPAALAVGAAGGLAAPIAVDKLGLREAEVRTVGSATAWGGVIGGLFGDIARTQGTSAREVLVAASLGSTLAGLGGYAIARNATLTRGDVALIDTLAGIGAVGGVTVGMVMQPAEGEAYSLNSALGVAGGVIAGYVAGPKTSTTPRRMLRVAGLAAAGGVAPLLLYAAIHDPGSTVDDRITGLLSSGGLVLGAYLGFRWTRGMDEGLDTPDGKPRAADDDAPIALVGRSSSGRWALGGLGVLPLSPALAPQRGLALQLVGATF